MEIISVFSLFVIFEIKRLVSSFKCERETRSFVTFFSFKAGLISVAFFIIPAAEDILGVKTVL